MSTIAKKSLLLNSANVGALYTAAAPLDLLQWIDYSSADEMLLVIDVQQTLNNPTAGQLFAKFQKRLTHKTGAIQYSQQRLVDLSAEEKAGMLPLGDWPSPLADYSLAGPATHQRVVTYFGPGVNLALYTAGLASGSANPGFQVTVEVHTKGRA